MIAAVSESVEQSKDVLSAFKAAAKSLQDEFDFVLFNGGIFGAFLPLVGLDVSQLPTLAIVGIKGFETAWDPAQQVSNKAVLHWLREWHATQPQESESPVFGAESAVTLVDLAALNAVLQGSDPRHVFVEFYAQWCVNCRAATPVWEQLAAQLSAPIMGHELVVGAYDLDLEALPVEAQLNVSVALGPSSAPHSPPLPTGLRAAELLAVARTQQHASLLPRPAHPRAPHAVRHRSAQVSQFDASVTTVPLTALQHRTRGANVNARVYVTIYNTRIKHHLKCAILRLRDSRNEAASCRWSTRPAR